MDTTVDTSPPRPVRKLVTVRQIREKERLKNHRYDVLHIDGWTVIVPGNEYEEGQLVVYFEIDSFLPATNRLFGEYMLNRMEVQDGVYGHRVRSRTVDRAISQGVVFALDRVPEVNGVLEDLTRKLGRKEALKSIFNMSFEKELRVKKWEVVMDDNNPEASLGRPPTFFPQPGCERAQNIIGLFSPGGRYLDRVFQVTEKLDGVTMSIYTVRSGSRWYDSLTALPEGCGMAMENKHGRVGVCSRSLDFIDNGRNLYWEVAKKLGLPEKISQIGDNVAVQGELCGPSIQGNSLRLPDGEHTFIVFGIWDIERQQEMQPKNVLAICNRLGIAHVPVLEYSTVRQFAPNMDALIKKADGIGTNGTVREGFVFKSGNGKEQFKVISNKWLILTGK